MVLKNQLHFQYDTKDTTINFSVLTGTPFFFFLFQKYFHAVFFPTQPKATVILALRRHYNQ